MTSIQRWFVASMLLASAPMAGAGAGHPTPGVGADVPHQQTTDESGDGGQLETDELEEDEEPDCE